MAILVTSDWQTAYENLHLCEEAQREVIDIVKKYSINTVLLLGDLKNQYNPCDLRVVSQWVKFISKLTSNDVEVLVLLGNHDRIGQYTDAQNWLPILKRAGAKVVEVAEVVKYEDVRFFCLPFSASIDCTKEWADQLLVHKPNSEKDILLFHNDIQGSFYNTVTSSKQTRLYPKDIHHKKYKYCIGGHIHLPQKFAENCYYVGSPFSTDWGESNQFKRYLVLKDNKLLSIPSKIPGRLDPGVKGFKSLDDYRGWKVRIKVQIPAGINWQHYVTRVKAEKQQEYPGAEIHIQHEFTKTEEGTLKVKFHDTDDVKIRTYVEETLPDTLEQWKEHVVAYLVHKLGAGKILRDTGGVSFIGAWAKNYISYNSVQLDFRNQGLKVISAENKDWGGSNGGGKSALVDMPVVALFGNTRKGQGFDRWASTNNTDAAEVNLKFKDSFGREVWIRRFRRPSGLQILVNGVDHSSGIRGQDTQKQIEFLSGYTWDTFVCGVYIDESIITSFMNGTSKQRKELLNRFQNLERFEQALTAVKADHRDLEVMSLGFTLAIDAANETIIHCTDVLKTVKPDAGVLNALKQRLKVQKVEYDSLVETYRAKKVDYNQLSGAILRQQELESKSIDTKVVLKSLQTAMAELKSMPDVCVVCKQKVNRKVIFQHEQEVISAFKEKGTQLAKITYELKTISETVSVLTQQKEEAEDARLEAVRLEKSIKETVQSISEWQARYDRDVALKHKMKVQVSKAKSLKHYSELAAKDCEQEELFYDYCERAFSRDGLPAYLNACLCPLLNKAAADYSELFSDNEIQVRFESNDSDFDIKVLNANGGPAFEDQSSGERRIASLIACFALRELMPATNILILDEPCENLDATNSKRFGEGIIKLKDKFETIFLTTHSPTLLSYLAAEDEIVIEKKDGVSQIKGRRL